MLFNVDMYLGMRNLKLNIKITSTIICSILHLLLKTIIEFT